MATVTQFGLSDHGRTLTLEQFTESDYESGHKYELIEGRLYVTPSPNHPHNWIQRYIHEELVVYRRSHPGVVGCLGVQCRVFVPGATWVTAPEPDIAIYHEFPVGPDVDWRLVSPSIVVEIISESDPEKDLVRNVDLYRQVPSIKEYWVLDNRHDAARPTMRVFRRAGDGWSTQDIAFAATYTTPLLPEFSLVVDPGQQ